jgi:UDP-N-acetylmuramate dehydrogenase
VIEKIENKDLKELCTLGIGGPARYFIEVKTIDQMHEAIHFSREQKLPFFILGKGSNCLFDDRGYQGVVIQNKIDFMKETEPGVFHVGAGYSFSLLGVQTARKGWSGLEFASGIPCTVGGAVFMNAGANGMETFQTLTSVDFISDDGIISNIKKEELIFSYRHSSFQQMKGAILGATFTLNKVEGAREKQLTIIAYRTKTQPYGSKSAGCIFRNPEGAHAGALIEKCGLKGQSVGGAQVSEMHANFLINKESAKSTDMLKLIEKIRTEVKEQTGFELESEVRYIKYHE